MRTKNIRVRTFRSRLIGMFAMAMFPMLVVGCAQAGFAQATTTKTFSSAGEACDILFQAAQKSDERELEAILGAEKEITSSGDEIEDKLERERFRQKYQEMHRLVREADGSTVLYIGAENWPFPIPLISKNGTWYFDSKTGKEEIKFRRIGENEATAIQVCEEFAMTKRENNAKTEDMKASSEDPITRFAQSLVTTSAVNAGNSEVTPFHGYYFRILTGDSGNGTTKSASGRKRGVVVLVA